MNLNTATSLLSVFNPFNPVVTLAKIGFNAGKRNLVVDRIEQFGCSNIAVDHEGLQAYDANNPNRQMRMKCNFAILDNRYRPIKQQNDIIIGPGTYAELNAQAKAIHERLSRENRI